MELICVDKNQVLKMIKKHQFRDLKELFGSNGNICENCKYYVKPTEEYVLPNCTEHDMVVDYNDFCSMWEERKIINYRFVLNIGGEQKWALEKY